MGNIGFFKEYRHVVLVRMLCSIVMSVVVNILMYYFTIVSVCNEAIRTGEISVSRIIFYIAIISLVNVIYLGGCFKIAHVFSRKYSAVQQLSSELKEMSYRDKMTGTRNRTAYFDDMRVLCQNSEKNVGIIFCDLNGLKTANDNFGHEAGDALICEGVVLLTEKFNRPEDSVYRIGGDEFVVCRKNISQEDFYESAQLFVEALDDYPIMSVGEIWLEECTDIENQIKEADEIMYQRKTEYYRKAGKERRK